MKNAAKRKEALMERVMSEGYIVTASPRMPSSVRSVGVTNRDGVRIEEVKQVVMGEELTRSLSAIKTALVRLLRRYTIPLEVLGGYLVPEKRWETLKGDIEALKEKWVKAVDEAADQLPADLEALIAANPSQEDLIRAMAISPEKFRKSCSFLFAAIRIQPEQIVLDGISEELEDMAEQVVEDLGKLVRVAKRHENLPTDATATKFVAMLQAKVASFAYVDDRLKRVAMQLHVVQQKLPTTGLLSVAQQNLAFDAFQALCGTPSGVLNKGLGLDAQLALVMAEAASAQPVRVKRVSGKASNPVGSGLEQPVSAQVAPSQDEQSAPVAVQTPAVVLPDPVAIPVLVPAVPVSVPVQRPAMAPARQRTANSVAF